MNPPQRPCTTGRERLHCIYAVKSLQDLRILRAMWEASDYVEEPGMEPAFGRLESLIGDNGMYVPTLDPSPVQNLLEYEMGPANFYYLLDDHRAEVEELLAIMHAKRLREYEVLARRSPAEVAIPVENTSSTLISPRLYRAYSLPQIRDYGRLTWCSGLRPTACPRHWRSSWP